MSDPYSRIPPHANDGQITAGQICYIPIIGPDGKTVYHQFKAVVARYQTPTGVVRGIQWVPADVTGILPPSPGPANQDFQQPLQRQYQQNQQQQSQRQAGVEQVALYPTPDTLPRDVSSYHEGGQLPTQRPVSSHHGGVALPSHWPVSHHEPIEGDLLPPPEGFNRPPNPEQSYPRFETIKIQDVDLMGGIPEMPNVLGPHDVYQPDWNRFMQDFSNAWLGWLPIPEYAKQEGRVLKRSTLATDLVKVWNDSFFFPRGVELILYKGRESRNGRYAGMVDPEFLGFDLAAGGISDYSSESSEQYSEDGGRDARARRKERQEQRAKKRLRDSERKYALHIKYLPAPGYA